MLPALIAPVSIRAVVEEKEAKEENGEGKFPELPRGSGTNLSFCRFDEGVDKPIASDTTPPLSDIPDVKTDKGPFPTSPPFPPPLPPRPIIPFSPTPIPETPLPPPPPPPPLPFPAETAAAAAAIELTETDDDFLKPSPNEPVRFKILSAMADMADDGVADDNNGVADDDAKADAVETGFKNKGKDAAAVDNDEDPFFGFDIAMDEFENDPIGSRDTSAVDRTKGAC
mmetsp:Transcript_5133/g.9495  ORF Transcript_5133/g.9495 Transcript_5133/m.9495 type:complete len:227 (+) Transcript_5133:170-850(+)